MAQRLRTLVTLAEDQCRVLNTHWFTTGYHSGSRGSNALFWAVTEFHLVPRHKCRQITRFLSLPALPLSPPHLKKEKQTNPANQAVSVEACSVEEKHGEQCFHAFLNTNRPPWGEAGLGFCVMTPISSPKGEIAAFNCPQTRVRLLPGL